MTFEIFFVTCRLGFASFPISSSKSEIFIETEASGIELHAAACKTGESQVLYFSWWILVDASQGLVSHGKDFINNLLEAMFYCSG